MENQNNVNSDIAEYLEYQSYLETLDSSFAKSFDSKLDNVKKDFEKIIQSFKEFSPSTDDVENFIEEKFYRSFSIKDLQNQLKPKEALIIYSYNWFDSFSNLNETLTQLCITKDKTTLSHKNLKEDEVDLVFTLKNELLNDRVLNKENSISISKKYYQIFSSGLNCNPGNFKKIFLLSNLSEIFNPSIFYDEDFLIKDTQMLIFQNIYRFLDWGKGDKVIKSYIGFGDADYSETEYEMLPLSQEEIIISSSNFRENKVFLEAEAKKSN